MTDAPTPPLGPSHEPAGPEPRAGWTVATAVLWAILIGVVVLIAVFQGTRSPAPPATPVDPKDTPSFILEFSGRYLVGLPVVMKGLPGAAQSQQLTRDQSLGQIDLLAANLKTDLERLRITPLWAEFGGREKAIERIDALLATGTLDPGLAEDAALFRKAIADGPVTLTDEEKARIEERHHWLGRLTASLSADDADPLRAGVLRDATRTAATLLGAFFAAFVIGAVGFVILIVGIILRATCSLRTRYRPDGSPRERIAFLEASVLFLVLLFPVQFVASVVGELWRPAGAIVLWSVLFMALWPMVRGVGWTGLRRGLGWHAGSMCGLRGGAIGVLREVGCGLLGYLAGVPLVMLAVGLVALVSYLTQRTASHPVTEGIGGANAGDLIAIYVLACLWAPLVEETFFRGSLYHSMRGTVGAVVSGIVTGLIFAIVHPQGWLGVPIIATLGFVFAMIREWRGSLIGPMVAHALVNGGTFTVLIIAMS